MNMNMKKKKKKGEEDEMGEKGEIRKEHRLIL